MLMVNQLIGFGASLGTPASTVLDSYAETNVSTTASQYNAFNEVIGQALNLPAGKTLTSVRFYCRKVGSPTGNITAQLKAATGSVGSTGTPTGSALASSVVDITTLTTTVGWVEFVFASPYVAASGDYCIETVFEGGNSSNYFEVSRDDTSPSHAGNAFYATNTVDAYNAQSGVDEIFELKGY